MQLAVSAIFLIFFLTTIISVLKGAPFVVSNQDTLDRILALSKIKKGEKVLDLGSGDGRIVIAFTKRGFQAYGIEINPLLILYSNIRAKLLGVAKNAHFTFGNMWKVDLANYDVIVLYAINYVMSDLEIKFKKELKRGTRVITHSYRFPSLKPVETLGNTNLYIF
jgi:cyclopropane fatty-acyl-phospholipid synthase-like methyltransferase